ncbi:hypothetical protein Rhe02_82380 [Rhizocola hellebori]|uniref:Uncharacterized protein n=1 Tax=Rhizocola hellebori TaxID=1392758 RepID=A0A8J3QGI9_9ACTN|nr:hypothetical protein Rhe02_82380 [Rhizocola hellebori]
MLRRVTRQQSITWWGSGSALLLFAVTGLIGALVRGGPPPGPWHVDVTSAAVAADLPPLQRADPANRWVIVRAKVEITGKTSATGLASILRLSGVDALVTTEPGVLLVRDGSKIDRLHPGLPEELAFAWEQKVGATPPTQVTVEVSGGSPVTIAVSTK